MSTALLLLPDFLLIVLGFLLCRHTALNRGVWDAVAAVNERFGMLGYGIVSLFMLCWIGSILFHRWRKPAPLSR